MIKKKETIYALSTSQGRSALALIRVSGPCSYRILRDMSSNMPNEPKIANFNEIKDSEGQTIDQTITTFFKAPKSFTGEDMVEVSVHGGNAVIKKILKELAKDKKSRMAYPGEFTKRAFENNKLNLTQVEAIADIISAETEMQRKQAFSHLSGGFFKSSKKIQNQLIKILANVEAFIDFSEDDLPNDMMLDTKEQIKNITKEIESIIGDSDKGISIREGFLVAILGKPNAGKSSFINNISDKDISIVTDRPGTTRDIIESFIDVGGYPIKFADTAGIRKSKNQIEKIGINKAISTSKEANVNLVFIGKEKEIGEFRDIKNSIFIKSKQDLSGEAFDQKKYYNISSTSNYGVKELLSIIKNKISKETPNEKNYISRERHKDCLKKTLFYLQKSTEGKNTDMFAEDIRLAAKSLSELFGGLDIEEILDIIFSDFCIGK